MDGSTEAHRGGYTLLLRTSPDIRWEGLQRLLEREPLIEVVRDVPAREILPAAARLQPDGILLAADPGVDTMLSSVRSIREQQPGTRLVVFGDQVDDQLETELVHLDASGLLLWKDVNAVSLCWTLGAVLEAGLHVASPGAAREIVFHERRARRREEGRAFSDQERLVMAGLARGLSERRIADEQRMAPRTVERTVARLIKQLPARDLHDLRRRAHDLGFGAE